MNVWSRWFSPTPSWNNMRKSKWAHKSSPSNSGWQVPKIFELPAARWCNLPTFSYSCVFFWWGGFPDPITKNSSWSDQTRQWMVAISFNQKWGKRAWIEDTKPMRSFKLSFEVEVLCCSFEGSLKFIFENFTEFLNPPQSPKALVYMKVLCLDPFIFSIVSLWGKKSRRRPKCSSFPGNLLSFLMFKHTWNTHSSLHG